ncbi:MAG: hypothetical protein NT018_04045 [Armatimonadetes bacterium]|nr:hypothetical protein [Armatimonadota bacterium]
MRLRWILAFALLVALGYTAFPLLQQVTADGSWGSQGLTQNAVSHAGVLGLLAGFVATIVVIFLTREEAGDSEDAPEGGLPEEDQESWFKYGAIATFLCTFFIAILGSFQYASFTGLAEYWVNLGIAVDPARPWLTQVAAEYPGLVFNILSVDYLLAVYLSFYGLVLTMRFCVPRITGLHILTYYLLTMIFLLGSLWVFLDYALTNFRVTQTVNFALLGKCYLGLVITAQLLSVLFWRAIRPRVMGLLYIGLAVCVGFVVGCGAMFASYSSASPELAQSYLASTHTVVWVIGMCMAALFAWFTLCLNVLLLNTRADKRLVPRKQTTRRP